MFGGSRRHRPPNPHLTSTNTNHNASTATAAAFMGNKSLSSAAAAAALRSRPQTPTNVAEVQTKRTMRRSSSVSSAASSGRGAPRLERRGSSGSMTERTFRSPSPLRSQPWQPAAHQHPPVPTIPAGHRKTTSMASAGVGMQNFLTASQKMDAGLPSWYTHPTGDPSNVRTSDAIMTSATPKPQAAEPERITSPTPRPDSRSSSINFSYPSRGRAQSPPASPSAEYNSGWTSLSPRTPASPPRSSRGSVISSSSQTSQALVYDPNSRRMVPKLDLMEVEHHVREASNKQPKKKKIDSGVQRSGSHLAKGTVARVRGTTVDGDGKQRDAARREQPVVDTPAAVEKSPVFEQDPTVKAMVTVPPQKHKEPVAREAPSPEMEEPRAQSVSYTPQESHERITTLRDVRKVGKKPSIVKEETEEDDEETEPAFLPSRAPMVALDALPSRETLHAHQNVMPEQRQAPAKPPEDEKESWNLSHAHSKPVAAPVQEKKPALVENKPVAGLSRENGSVRRSASNSPARTARFAPSLSEQLAVRHAPPPRSASPIKSALKQSSPSPRDGSPSDDGSERSNRGASPNSEPSILRKKSVRVSFDDRNTIVVGESAPVEDVDSPVVPSLQQQTKRPWYSSIGRSKKKDFALEDDEVMKPRPALPSFGSVREKKNRESGIEERPLVRPHEPANSLATPTSPPVRPHSPSAPDATSKAETAAVGQSSDQVIGSLLAQEQASRNEANISRFREPLPLVVTSLEGNGYVLDHTSSSESYEEQFDSVDGDSDADVYPSTQTTQLSPAETVDHSQNGSILDEKASPEPQNAMKTTELPAQQIPRISIIHPSPSIAEQGVSPKKLPRGQYFDIPGGFPEEESDGSRVSEENADDVTGSSSVSAVPDSTIFEPEADCMPSQASSLPQTTLATTPQLVFSDNKADNDSESNSSIYSDAHEDIPEAEGFGFQSIDAVVESPVSKTSATQLAELATPPLADVERPQSELHPAVQAKVFAQAPESVRNENDWEQAKSFWRSLTAAKRRQLEREALEDAGADGDQEEVEAPVRRSSSRKKTPEERQATAIAAKARASASAATTIPEQPIDPDRIYMIQPGSKAKHEPISPTPARRIHNSTREEQPAKGTRVAKAAHEGGHLHKPTRPSAETEVAAPRENVVMRRSMRPTAGSDAAAPSDGAHMRKSMRTGAGSGAVNQRASRPATSKGEQTASSSPVTKAPKRSQSAHQHNRSASFDVALAAGQAFSKNSERPLRRRGSDASDSSFKRSRAGPPVRTYIGGFRKSMRQASEPQPFVEEAKGSGRFSLRSMSPGGSPFRRASTNTAAAPPVSMGMRRTLRSGSESSRDSHEGKRSMHLRSFGRSNKTAEAKAPRRASRLGSSSDEDEPNASGFRSRFEDSSSDDARPGPEPARTLSKGTVRGSNPATSLRKSKTVPEEAEESEGLLVSDKATSRQMPSSLQSPQAAAGFRPSGGRSNSGIGTSTLRRQHSGRGALATATTAPSIKSTRRLSLLGGMLSRNKKVDSSPRFHRSDLQPSTLKLQKKSPLSRRDSWPLPEPDYERPTTSGGTETGISGIEPTRPSFKARRSTSLGLPAAEGLSTTSSVDVDESVVAGGGQKKKKKFGALRRMFKLDD